MSGTNITNLVSNVNTELVKVNEWIRKNKLSVNTDKTHYMILSRKKPIPNDLPLICIDGTPINKVDDTKFLGLTIDSKLSWREHISEVQKKIIKQCGILYHIRDSLTIKAMTQLYYSLVYPHITYCHVVWGGLSDHRLNPINLSQKRFIRVLSYLKKYDHTNNAFSHLNILKLKEVNEYCTALFVYKSLSNPDDHMFTMRTNPHYNLRQSTLLKLPAVQSAQSKSFIAFHGVKIWNILPEDIRRAPSIPSFKRSLKKYLLSKYDSTVQGTVL